MVVTSSTYSVHYQKHLQAMDKDPSISNMNNNIYNQASNEFNSASTLVDNSKGHDLNSCIFQAQVWAERARSRYREKEQSLQACIGRQSEILQEIKKRDEVIRFLQGDIKQEKLSSKKQVHRLKREFRIMRELVMGYRMQMKDLNRKFSEYRARQAHHVNLSDINAVGSGSPFVGTKEVED